MYAKLLVYTILNPAYPKEHVYYIYSIILFSRTFYILLLCYVWYLW